MVKYADKNDGHEGRHFCLEFPAAGGTSVPRGPTEGSTRLSQEAERTRGKAWAIASLSFSRGRQSKIKIVEIGLPGLNNFRGL